MRLRQLKISGFKSFADTTLIEFPGNLAGIVGPNGCGKSNVIDAIRWVLGEGRISELRGSTSMSELIFSGSANRPASSRASVEMVLDNSDGSITGPWGAYSELSIKRVVTRDGSNAYLINNQQVRRRDVQDVFMGTGLGPRSYAIISQGMISNFIKAKPEELRVYLEEAAGVSKYKERRKETESALTSTRSNLEKVAYLQETKRVEIERLTIEAETARRWEALEKERNDAELLSLLMQETDAHEQVDAINARVAKKEAELVAAQGDTQQITLKIETLKEASRAAREKTDAARQARFEAEKAVSNVEGNIRHIVERKDSANRQIATDQMLLKSRTQALDSAREREATLIDEARELCEKAAIAREEAQGLADQAEAAEHAYEDARQSYETARSCADQARNGIAVVNVKLESLEREMTDAEGRFDALTDEIEHTDAPDTARFEALPALLSEAQESVKSLLSEEADLAHEKETHEKALSTITQQISEETAALARVSARIQTLVGIQEKIGQEGALPKWLTKMGFDGAKRLFERIDVDPAWARALEAVLAAKAGALQMKDVTFAAGLESSVPPARLLFYEPVKKAPHKKESDLTPLLNYVRTEDAVTEGALKVWLSGVYVAENLSQAIERKSALGDGERFVTRDGHTVDAFSVSFWAEENEASGALSRAAQIRTLTEKETEIKGVLSTLTSQEALTKGTLTTLNGRIRENAEKLAASRETHHELEVQLTRLTEQIEAYKARTQKANAEREELAARIEDLTAKRDAAEEEFEELDRKLGLKEQAVTDAQILLEEAEQRAGEADRALTDKNAEEKMALLEADACEERSRDAAREAESAQGEMARLTAEIASLQTELEGLNLQAEQEGLLRVTQELDAARANLMEAEKAADAAENAVEEARSRLSDLVAAQAPLMQEISDLKVKRQTYVTQGEAFTARLEELKADRKSLRARVIDEHVKLTAMKGKLTRLAQEIAGLGPVNHAALENLEASQAAMQETERQVEDLNEAIANLEATIRKIDAETRELLRTTFETVNRNFGQMFTGLFGGGSASLRLTGEEILDTGIDVIAQPPGKKNTSVKILSGGEQALTATALVFAIFKLNPAPFCLLDEVDAPLDEANQDRLVKKIADMSEATQFVMITHHRVSMEQLKQLVGVTMKEPGVSRVVAVDVEQAAQLAQP